MVRNGVARDHEEPRQWLGGHVLQSAPRNQEDVSDDLLGIVLPDAPEHVCLNAGALLGPQRCEALLVTGCALPRSVRVASHI